MPYPFQISSSTDSICEQNMTEAIQSAAGSVKSAIVDRVYGRPPKEPEDWVTWTQVEKPVEDEDRKM